MWILLFSFLVQPLWAVNVKDLISRTEQQSFGKSFEGRLRMVVSRDGNDRELEILSWTEGRDKAMVKVLKPAKDRGTANLRLEFNLWQYLPKVERTIKVPPSLMLQSWMGSDFTNDDLVKSSRFSRDYDCKFEGNEKLENVDVVKLVCDPKPKAPVVWGKLHLWIEPKKAVLMAQDFYSEKGELLKKMTASNVKTFGTHTIASKLTMKTLKKDTTTVLEYLDAKFDQKFDGKVFTQNFLQAPLR